MNAAKEAPLLITAALDAGRTPQVALSGISERVLKHMEGLVAWLRDPRVGRIVFAKNCGVKISREALLRKASDYGKDLEYLQVSNSMRTITQGKGYGEGDLIRQALGKSEILRSSDDFIKVTGKLYSPRLVDFDVSGKLAVFYRGDVGQSSNAGWIRRKVAPAYRSEMGSRALAFMRRRMRVPWGLVGAVPQGWIDTRFYRVRREFYLDTLIRSHQRVHDALGYTLENAVFDDLNPHDVRLIQSPPVILGTSGTLGTTAGKYDREIQDEAEELAGRLIL